MTEAPRQLTPTQRIVRMVGALLFSWGYASIPWYSWRPRSFKDIAAYTTQIESLRANAEELDFDRLTTAEYVFSEPLWRQLLSALDVSNDPLDALSLVTFGVVLVFTNHLFVRASPWLVMYVMFNPLMIDLVVSQTRSALAVALLLTASATRYRFVGLFLVLSASLIHSITFLLVGVYIVARVIERYGSRLGHVTLGWTTLAIGLVLGAAIAVGRADALQAVGDRRAYVDNTAGTTVAYTLYWVLLACALVMTYRMQAKIVWEDFFAIMIMIIPFATTILNASTTRLIALCLPMTIDCIVARPRAVRVWLVLSLVAYQILHYQYWLS